MEPLKVTVLGTAGTVPQKDRTFASILISFRGDNLLFDVPEGTQKQLIMSEHSMMKIKNVFISHLHVDHFLGLFGWLATMTLNERKEKLTIFAPRGGKEKIMRIMKETIRPSFFVDIKETKKGVILKGNGFSVTAYPLKHEIPCFGFSFLENDKLGEFDKKKALKLGVKEGPDFSKLVRGGKVVVKGKTITQKDVMNLKKARRGRKISVVSDTRPTNEAVKGAKDADVLVHEATFVEEHKQKAKERMHSTAMEAGEIASKAKAKMLILYHFSARRAPEKVILSEAKKKFKNTFILKELETISV